MTRALSFALDWLGSALLALAWPEHGESGEEGGPVDGGIRDVCSDWDGVDG